MFPIGLDVFFTDRYEILLYTEIENPISSNCLLFKDTLYEVYTWTWEYQ